VSDRIDLEGKLAGASDWVRDEFGFIGDLAGELGCEVHPESGPGLAFRVRDQVIARAHPKGAHIGVGLPDWMRPDVQALTGALRDQRGFAWFNYAPGIADRDTIELLVAVSRDAVEAPTTIDATPDTRRAQPARRIHTRASRDDDADLALVLAILQAYKRHADATGFASAVKPIREAIFFQWEGPRLPPGRKYSLQLPHSPAARAQRAAGRHDGLVYEHVAPISHIVRGLLGQLPTNTAALRTELEATTDRVITTRAEDARLTAAGVRDSAPDGRDPWSRYRVIGLDKADFQPITTIHERGHAQ
jgi:hypothetical protein